MSKLTSVLIFAHLSTLGQAAPAQILKIVQNTIVHSNPQQNGLGQAGLFAPFVSLGVGQPPQNISVLLDTGSADLIIPQTGSNVCQIPLQECTGSGFVTGSFDPTKSSNVQNLSIPLNASFANGVFQTGSYINAPLTIGNMNHSIPNNQIGLYNFAFLPPDQTPFPVFGISPPNGEAAQNVYPNVPAHLKQVGAIRSNMFSIYMNDFRSPSGNLTFGGIDTEKFDGQLKPAPILTGKDGLISDFVVPFSSMKLVNGDSEDDSSDLDLTPQKGLPPSLLDTGNPALDVPSSSVKALAKAIGTTYDEEEGQLGPVPCDIGAKNQSLCFGFNNDKVQINVPIDLVVFPDPTGNTTQCFLPINGVSSDEEDSNMSSLGAPFMQAAYIVFDLDGGSLYMAQAMVNATKTSLQEWGSYQSR